MVFHTKCCLWLVQISTNSACYFSYVFLYASRCFYCTSLCLELLEPHVIFYVFSLWENLFQVSFKSVCIAYFRSRFFNRVSLLFIVWRKYVDQFCNFTMTCTKTNWTSYDNIAKKYILHHCLPVFLNYINFATYKKFCLPSILITLRSY